MLYENRTASFSINSGARVAVPDVGAEPTTLGTANELLNYIATLEQHTYQLRGGLFGAQVESNQAPRELPSTLEGILRDACQRAASLCGDLQTLKSRLGVGL